MTQFIEVRNRFMAATEACKYPLTYEEWIILRDDLKAAALFVQFYDQITLAWIKAKSDFTVDEDGVSTVMQYIHKNVPVILADKKKFTPAYMYKVAYNCMGCLRRVKREQDRYAYTTSQYAVVDDNEVDMFSNLVGESHDMLNSIFSKEIWDMIEDMDEDTKSVIDHLLNHTRCTGPLAKKKKIIIQDLQKQFNMYHKVFIENKVDTCIRFSQVLDMDDCVSSAVVLMDDGRQAVYYGETVTAPDGTVKIVFFGDVKDYVVPVRDAKELIVVDIEKY